ncbi:hypothetical protein GHT07_12310 [Caenimonas koreensis DSM 17982]|uniref:Uncharacterized protein n=1 Tax=Caenimonas koreensis DSM 17982 TaxID=1121255 RepID=A0A844B9A3_9BURK|nr:hypothetical protein [Caenimonas koreensis]MRD48066.1 hypothetical protein [Caenimonas koreensis DSM 17982]
MKTTLVALAAALTMTGCNPDHSLMKRRATEWKSKADTEIPAGRSVEEARAWGSRNGIVFSDLEKQRQLYAIVERIPENGLSSYVCSDWSIILKVNLTASGTTVNNEVSTVGTCL